MKTTPTIAQLLTLSQQEYEDKILDLWLKYCKSNTYSVQKTDYQKLVANAALNNWWLQELSHIEAIFLEEYSSYSGQADPTLLAQKYDQEVLRLFRLHCLPLFQYARKLNIIPQN